MEMQSLPDIAYMQHFAKSGFSPVSAGSLRPISLADPKAKFLKPSLAPRAFRILGTSLSLGTL
jgi:hypothetical protein